MTHLKPLQAALTMTAPITPKSQEGAFTALEMAFVKDMPHIAMPASEVESESYVFYDNCEPSLANWYFVVSASVTTQGQVRWLLYRDGVRPFMACCEQGKRVRVVRGGEGE